MEDLLIYTTLWALRFSALLVVVDVFGSHGRRGESWYGREVTLGGQESNDVYVAPDHSGKSGAVKMNL
jgi:hypothetical protein